MEIPLPQDNHSWKEEKSPEVFLKYPKTKSNKKTFFFLGTLLFILVGVVAVYSSFNLYKIKNPTYQQKVLEKKANAIFESVSEIIELPQEKPQITPVSDVESLKKVQPFFEKAQDGDYVLVFSAIAILYRPSSEKIINIASVVRDDKAPNTSLEESPELTSASTTKKKK
jgi:hypothetical protein